MEFDLTGCSFSQDIILRVGNKFAKIRSHENFMPHSRCRVGLEKGCVFRCNRTFWFVSAAYQTSFVFWRDGVELKIPMARPNKPGMPSNGTIRLKGWRNKTS